MCDPVDENALPCEAPLSRRAFVGGAAAAAAAVMGSMKLPTLRREGALPAARSEAELTSRVRQAHRGPVVGFHMDRPYLDPTGLAEPYVPPSGTRSGQMLAELSESEFLSRHPYG